MSLEAEIVIVSGLPRSGTSLMMQMLDRGGVPVLTDEIRTADVDNPRGYYELECVKRTKQDKSWLPKARGKAVKLVSPLLYDLPADERYRIIFMHRELDEVLASQEKMLQRRNQPAAPREQMKASFTLHLERLHEWLARQDHFRLLEVVYNDLLAEPVRQAPRIAEFLDHRAHMDSMLAAIDPNLYRNRTGHLFLGSTPNRFRTKK